MKGRGRDTSLRRAISTTTTTHPMTIATDAGANDQIVDIVVRPTTGGRRRG